MALHAVDGTAGTAQPQRIGSRLLTRLRNRLALGLLSRSVHIGLRRAVGRGLPIPAAQIPLLVRPLRPADVDVLLPADTQDLSRAEKGEIELRRRLVARLPEACFVAVDESRDEPCFMAWLLGPGRDTADLLDSLPPLESHQSVVEYAYIPPRYRGHGLMAPATLMVAEQALAIGVTEIIAFIGEINIPSLRGARRAGFKPYMRHVRTHFLFGLFHTDRFTPLAAGEDGWPADLDGQGGG